MKQNTALIILAGGLGTRVAGANKALLPFQRQPLIEHTLNQLGSSVAQIIISANRDLPALQNYGHAVITDLPRYRQMGPLAGIVSAAQILTPAIEYIQIVPCDMPFLTTDIITTLHQQLLEHPQLDIVCATDTERIHPIVCQMRRRHLHTIAAELNSKGKHSLRSIIEPFPHQNIAFDKTPSFTNFNCADMF